MEGDSESHLLLFNYSDKPRVFGVGISNGAILWDKKYTLAPNETREISFNELIQDKVPDGKGLILSPERQSGVVNWMVPDSGEGTGRLMVTSRPRVLARNFSCGQFIEPCGAYVYAASGLTVGSLDDVIWVVPQFCDFFSPSQCVGGNDVSNGSANYNWSVGASSVVRFAAPSDQYVASPQLYGVGAGSGYGNVTVTAGSCQVNGGGGYPVAPTITSISPSTILVGASNVNVTISGSGFGSSPVVNLPAGVSSSGQTASDSSIAITLSVAYSGTVGNASISVTANGQPSNQFPVVLDGPYQMVVVSDFTIHCGGCATTVDRSVTYQIRNFSGTNAGQTGICEVPTLTGWSCTQSMAGVSFQACTSPFITPSNGQFTDSWSLSSDIYTPVGCGTNITDNWDWFYHSPLQTLGVLTGYIHTNAISIDGVVSPSKLPVGTIMPF
ncbi:MAG: hypothetical protein ABSG62_20705 [Terracidiphilus sp.]